MSRLRTPERGQSLVIIALSATVLFGIIALGLDAGRLYFERRDVQNAADAGALAGAQELLPRNGNPGVSPTMAFNARCVAAQYAFKTWNDTPLYACGSWAGAANPLPQPAASVPATITITTPSRGNPNEIAVQVDYNVPMTFAAIMGFQTSKVSAVAYAHGGFYNKTYTVFGFSSTGSGNSITDDQNGYAQIDNGRAGSDMCNIDNTRGKMVSNAKFHVPNPTQPGINLNGTFYYAQASDTHAIQLYWFGSVSPTTSNVEPVPNYEPPVQPGGDAPNRGVQSIGGRTAHIYYPGTYRNNLTIPFPSDGANDLYILQNGIYYFIDANFTISGGTISNTSDGQPRYTTFSDGFTGGITNLAPAADGTNGVEFVFDGNASFFATTSRSGNGPSVFFVAPSFVSSGTDSIAFFVKSTDTISGPTGTPWEETIDGTKPNTRFLLYGTIYNADNNGSNGTVANLTAVSTTLRGAGQPSDYAVTGEVVSPQADLDNGGLATESSITNSTPCPPGGSGTYNQNLAGLLVQFSPHYAPHFRGYSFLVK